MPLERVLSTELFDFEGAFRASGWLQELRGTHTPELEEYGIRSFVYRVQRPFHPERFFAWIESEWPGVELTEPPLRHDPGMEPTEPPLRHDPGMES